MAKKENKGIAVVGTVVVDRHPEAYGIGTTRLSCAGCVPNLTAMLKKLSPKMPVSAIGRVGNDPEGRYAVQWLHSVGIDTAGIKVVADESTGSRQGMLHIGALQNFGICDMAFRNVSCSILHLGYLLMMDKIDDGDGRKILKHAKQCGMETSLSMLSGVSDRYAAVLAALPYTDYFTVSLEDAAWLVKMDPEKDSIEKIARRLLWYGVKKKVFIYSPQWVACCSQSQYTLLGNYILPEKCTCSDEMLCDSFTAGVLTGLSNGWSDVKILEIASSCAAVKRCKAEEDSVRDMERYCKQFQRHKKVL